MHFGFIQWLKGSIVPGIVSLFLAPFVLKFMIKPKDYDQTELMKKTNDELEKCGKISNKEWVRRLVNFNTIY